MNSDLELLPPNLWPFIQLGSLLEASEVELAYLVKFEHHTSSFLTVFNGSEV
jgi:hypothetical protein